MRWRDEDTLRSCITCRNQRKPGNGHRRCGPRWCSWAWHVRWWLPSWAGGLVEPSSCHRPRQARAMRPVIDAYTH